MNYVGSAPRYVERDCIKCGKTIYVGCICASCTTPYNSSNCKTIEVYFDQNSHE